MYDQCFLSNLKKEANKINKILENKLHRKTRTKIKVHHSQIEMRTVIFLLSFEIRNLTVTKDNSGSE